MNKIEHAVEEQVETSCSLTYSSSNNFSYRFLCLCPSETFFILLKRLFYTHFFNLTFYFSKSDRIRYIYFGIGKIKRINYHRSKTNNQTKKILRMFGVSFEGLCPKVER